MYMKDQSHRGSPLHDSVVSDHVHTGRAPCQALSCSYPQQSSVSCWGTVPAPQGSSSRPMALGTQGKGPYLQSSCICSLKTTSIKCLLRKRYLGRYYALSCFDRNLALNSYRGNSKRGRKEKKKNTSVNGTCGWVLLPVPSPSHITASLPPIPYATRPVTGPSSLVDHHGKEPRLEPDSLAATLGTLLVLSRPWFPHL